MTEPLGARVERAIIAALSSGNVPLRFELSPADFTRFRNTAPSMFDKFSLADDGEVTFCQVRFRGGAIRGLFCEGPVPWRPI